MSHQIAQKAGDIFTMSRKNRKKKQPVLRCIHCMEIIDQIPDPKVGLTHGRSVFLTSMDPYDMTWLKCLYYEEGKWTYYG